MRQLSPSIRAVTVGVVATAVLAAGVLASGLLNAEAHAGKAPGALSPKDCIDDTTAGPDNCGQNVAGLQYAAAAAVSRDGKSVYVASEGSTLVRFKRNTTSGALTPKGCFGDVGDGPAGCQPIGGLSGAGSVVVSGDGKSVYVASESDSAVAIFKRDKHSGALTPKGCVQNVGIVGGDCTQSAAGLAGASFAVVTADGRSVYATSSDGAVVRFKRDTHSGALTPGGCIEDPMFAAGCAQTAAGLSGAGALAVSADNRSVYVSSESGRIVSFKRDKTNGKLTPKGCIQDSDNVPAVCPKDTQGLGNTEAVAVSDDGRSVYAVSGGDSAIVRFDRNPQTGALTSRGCIQDHDNAPICSKHAGGMEEGAGVAISHDGKSVYYGSGTDDAIVRFQRDKHSGALTPKGCIDDNDTSSDPNQGEDNCAKSANGLAKVTSVAISRDGKSVYTTTETDSAITRFKRKTG